MGTHHEDGGYSADVHIWAVYNGRFLKCRQVGGSRLLLHDDLLRLPQGAIVALGVEIDDAICLHKSRIVGMDGAFHVFEKVV